MTEASAQEPQQAGSRSSRRYDSPIRRERAAQTRERILASAAELVRKLSSWDWRSLTVRAVADRAGVHERTVYRHFPTERDLRDALMQWLERDAGVSTALEQLGLDELEDYVARVFRYMSTLAEPVRPPADVSLTTVDQRRRDAVLATVTDATPGWSDDDRRLAAAMIDVLWGVPSYRRLAREWRLDSAEAARGTNWLIGMVADAIRADRPPPDGAKA